MGADPHRQHVALEEAQRSPAGRGLQTFRHKTTGRVHMMEWDGLKLKGPICYKTYPENLLSAEASAVDPGDVCGDCAQIISGRVGKYNPPKGAA